MLAPRLYETTAFDAAKKHTFQFIWTGEQMFGVRLTVRNNANNNQVYQGTITTMRQEYELPAGSISNGGLYNAYVEILDANSQIISEKSNAVVFYTVTTPTFEFTAPVDSQIIASSSLTAVLSYSQAENEVLSQYQINLYDASYNLIRNYGMKSQTEYSTEFTQIITGLEDDYNYYIRAIGAIAKGMSLDTGYIRFNVNYVSPSVFSKLDLVNDRLNGNISITSNLIQIIGHAEPEEIYIDNRMLDVRNGVVTFDQGYAFPNNWVAGVSMYRPPLNAPVITWTDGDNTGTIYYREAVFDINLDENDQPVNKGYFELLINGPLGNTIIDSGYIPPNSNTQMQDGVVTGYAEDNYKLSLWIIKSGNYYQLIIVPEGEGS